MRLIVLSLLFPLFASAQEGVLSAELPSLQSRGESSLLHRALDGACGVIDIHSSFLPCNPSLLPLSAPEKGQFSARVFLGNEYKQFQTVHQLLQGPHSEEFVESLFEQNQVLEAEASGDLVFRSKYFGASFTPYRLMYFSVVRNKAHPIIALRAMQERILRLQGAYAFSDEFSLGLQSRIVRREFIQNEFSLYDALTDEENVLKKKAQNVIYLEPGLTYQTQTRWRSRWTAQLTNIGVADEYHDETKMFPVLDLGFGLQPPVGLGKLDFGLNYRAQETVREAGRNFDFGASYAVGLIQGVVGWGTEESHLGLATRFWSAQVGIVFSSEKIRLPDDRSEYRDSIFTEFSFMF